MNKFYSFLPLTLITLSLVILLHLSASIAYAVQPVFGSWVSAGLTSYTVKGLAIDASNPNIFYAGADGNGIFKTTDAGNNWIPMNNGLPSNFSPFGVIIDSSNSLVLYTGGGGIWKSIDGGLSWVNVTNGIDFSDTYAGTTSMAIDPNNPQIVYAGIYHSGLWKTTNGGSSWSNVLARDIYTIAIDHSNSNIIFVGGGAGDMVVKSTDGGTTWTSLANPGQLGSCGGTGAVRGITIDSQNSNILYVNPNPAPCAASSVYKSLDGGANWAPFFTSPWSTNVALSVDHANSNIIYAAMFGSIPFKSIDGGATWLKINSGLFGKNIGQLIIPDNYPNEIFATTNDGLHVYGLQNPNLSPVINSFVGGTLNQGDTYSISGSFMDPDSSSWTGTVDYGDGSGVQPLTFNGMGFSLNHQYSNVGVYTVTVTITDNQNASSTATAKITVERQLVSLNPVKVWIGSKDDDSKVDLRAEVYKDENLVSSGEVDGIRIRGENFKKAKLITIPFVAFSSVNFSDGSKLSLKLLTKRTCSRENDDSAKIALWYNDGQANSHFGATIGDNVSDYFLRENFVLDSLVGTGPRKEIDIKFGKKDGCSVFKSFGTWSINF